MAGEREALGEDFDGDDAPLRQTLPLAARLAAVGGEEEVVGVRGL